MVCSADVLTLSISLQPSDSDENLNLNLQMLALQLPAKSSETLKIFLHKEDTFTSRHFLQ